jgi:hypothetical protein
MYNLHDDVMEQKREQNFFFVAMIQTTFSALVDARVLSASFGVAWSGKTVELMRKFHGECFDISINLKHIPCFRIFFFSYLVDAEDEAERSDLMRLRVALELELFCQEQTISVPFSVAFFSSSPFTVHLPLRNVSASLSSHSQAFRILI